MNDRQRIDLDLLQAAWGLSDPEFEQLLNMPSGWLRELRNHEVEPTPEMELRIDRLRRFHRALMLHPSKDYPRLWKVRWSVDSATQGRSILQAFAQDGDEALDVVQKYLWAQAAGN